MHKSWRFGFSVEIFLLRHERGFICCMSLCKPRQVSQCSSRQLKLELQNEFTLQHIWLNNKFMLATTGCIWTELYNVGEFVRLDTFFVERKRRRFSFVRISKNGLLHFMTTHRGRQQKQQRERNCRLSTKSFNLLDVFLFSMKISSRASFY